MGNSSYSNYVKEWLLLGKADQKKTKIKIEKKKKAYSLNTLNSSGVKHFNNTSWIIHVVLLLVVSHLLKHNIHKLWFRRSGAVRQNETIVSQQTPNSLLGKHDCVERNSCRGHIPAQGHGHAGGKCRESFANISCLYHFVVILCLWNIFLCLVHGVMTDGCMTWNRLLNTSTSLSIK